MAYSDIDKPSEYFNTKLYTGNGSTQSITGVGFQPDWVWLKARDTTYNHQLFDSVRGATIRLFSDLTNAESTNASSLTSFDSDGFSIGNIVGINESPRPYVSWNWLAGGTASSNTDGSITSSVSANTTSGFSIVSYTGNGVAGATVGHGLGAVPKMLIIKRRNNIDNWPVYHSDLGGSNNSIFLELTNAKRDDLNMWNSTTPSSSLVTIGDRDEVNNDGSTYIAYCFAEKKGFSKFGSYTGNSNADGTFVYTGFKPSWVMVKASSSTGSWNMYDNKRETFNVMDSLLFAEGNYSETTSSVNLIDFTSNGFKCRGTGSGTNDSAITYIYMAFAENPLVTSTGIPATAR